MQRSKPAILAVCLLGAAAMAQQKWLPDYAGKVGLTAPETGGAADWGASASEAKAYGQDITRLWDVVRSQPPIKAPRGVRLGGYIHPETPDDFNPRLNAKAPIPTFGTVMFYPLFDMDGKVVDPSETDIEMVFTINETEHIADVLGAGDHRDADGRCIYVEPTKVGEIQGFPLYERRHGGVYDMLVLTHTTRPLWKPVTQEQFIRGELRGMEREQERQWLQGHMATEKRPAFAPTPLMTSYQKALDAMSQSEREAPARYQIAAKAGMPDLAPAGSTKGETLVIANPDWYDPSLPRSAIQLVVVSTSYGQWDRFDPTHPQWDGKMSIGPVRLYEAMRSIDWKAIAALIR